MLGRKQTQPAVPPLKNPLAVIPRIPPNLELKVDENGILHIRQHPKVGKLQARIGRWLHFDYTKRFELDEVGTMFYGLIDGRKRVRDIVDEMARTLKKPRKDIERSVVIYLKTLMERQMILLEVTGESVHGGAP